MLRPYKALLMILGLALAGCGAAQPAAPAATSAPAQATSAPVSGGTAPNPCTPEAASAERPDPPILEIGTGNTGGVFFPYGGGIARVLTEKLPGAQVTAQETGGSVDNMKLIDSEEADLGLTTVDSAYDALLGQGAYKDTGPIPACTIVVLYQSFVHIVARDDASINTVADMKGKTISVGSAGSSTEGAADRILEAAGLDPKADITRENLSVSDSTAAIKDQKIDAFFWIGGLPTAAVKELVSTPNVKVKFIAAEEYVKPLTDKYGPVYTPFTLMKGIYTGVEADVPGIGIGNIVFVNANMNEQLVYDILKTLFDNLASVQASHPEAKKLSLETAAIGSSIPFHPGAIRFYKEKGVWKE